MISYLNSTSFCKSITADDLGNIHGITGRTDVVKTVNDTESDTGERKTDSKYIFGEHVTAYWLKGHIVRWYLGIVETEKSKKLLISYMIPVDSN